MDALLDGDASGAYLLLDCLVELVEEVVACYRELT
jgi:hypothetical protein